MKKPTIVLGKLYRCNYSGLDVSVFEAPWSDKDVGVRCGVVPPDNMFMIVEHKAVGECGLRGYLRWVRVVGKDFVGWILVNVYRLERV